jgi:hypothetical protein
MTQVVNSTDARLSPATSKTTAPDLAHWTAGSSRTSSSM